MRALAVCAVLGLYGAFGAVLLAPDGRPRVATPAAVDSAPQTRSPVPRARTAIVWHRSRALGRPDAGRLAGAVRLPARGPGFRTWDPALKRSPNRWWRRNGTDRLVRLLLRVARDYPGPRPLLIGDLSRPHGGDFGRRYGPLGHVSHQNGLDVDVYFPRRDRKLRAARRLEQVDRRRAQWLVDRFLRAGAVRIFVGAGLRLRGPSSVVQPWPHHDDHLHVRLGG